MPAAGSRCKRVSSASNDGSTWGVTSADKNMYMNDYVGQTVTVTGDAVHPSARLKTVASKQDSPTIQHYLRAMDVVVESTACNK